MRSGSTWTYDAGAALKSGDVFFWSNGVALRSGTTFRHTNSTGLGGVTPEGLNYLSYANGITFKSSSNALFYPGTQPLRDTSFNHYYASGTNLENGNTLYYSTGAVMADASGNVFNENGTPTFKPYSRYQTVGAAVFETQIGQHDGEVTVSIQDNSGGSFGAYVTRIKIDYQIAPPDPTDLNVTYIDPTTLLFQWSSGGGSTAGYRVAWNTGVSAPGDVATGIDTTNNYYVVSGLTPGQKVSLRVAAKDDEGDVSYGAIATGTAGALQQAEQTGELVASALDTTFVQAYDTVDRNILLTVDSHGNSFVWYYVNDELGYVNIDNGDRISANLYRQPESMMQLTEVIDAHPIGNLSQIPSGAQYESGRLLRNGNTFYHDLPGSVVLRSSSNTWFYPSGNTMKNASTTFWPGSITMRSGTTARYANNAILKSGTTFSYMNGTVFTNGVIAQYPNGSTLRNSLDELSYETGSSLYMDDSFYYPAGAVMIDPTGPFLPAGGPAEYPFEYVNYFVSSNVYIAADEDRIARYAVPVVASSTAVHVLGGVVDYSVAPPPVPTSLVVDSETATAVTFEITSGGGTTQDFVYAWSLGEIAPWTPEGGMVVSGDSFTIEGLQAGQQVAVRLFARNSEGEFSPGITAVGTTSAPPELLGDYNSNGVVDAADYSVWMDTLGSTSDLRADGDGDGSVDADDYGVWVSHFGEVLEQGAGSRGQGVEESGGGAVALEPVLASMFAPQPPADPEAGYPAGVNGVAAFESSLESSRFEVAPFEIVPVRAANRFGKPPADPESGYPAGAEGEIRVAIQHRDGALLAWLTSQDAEIGCDDVDSDREPVVTAAGLESEDGAIESLALAFATL